MEQLTPRAPRHSSGGTALQRFLVAFRDAVQDLARDGSLRELEEAQEISRYVFARHIAQKWAQTADWRDAA